MASTDKYNSPQYHDKYVVVYDFSNIDGDIALDELSTLLSNLEKTGLHTVVRAGYNQTVLIFVQAPRALLKETVYRSRVRDWLFGITRHHPESKANRATASFSEAENILSMFHLVNWRKELGGAGVTPEYGSWENVKAIYPLHNDAVNRVVLRRLSKKFFLDNQDLDCVRDLWGAKVAFYFAFMQTYFLFLIFPCVAGGFAWIFLPNYSLTFAFIIGVWCTTFLEYWKIQEVDLAIRWQVRGVGSVKVNRPQFRYEAEMRDTTGTVQYYFPKWKHIMRQMVLVPFVMLSTMSLGTIVTALFAIEIFITETYEGPYRCYLEYLPNVLLAILLPYIGNKLEETASAMTEYENHRTQDDHEMSLTQKIFILNFITNYLPILLSAFVYVPFGHMLVPYLRDSVFAIIGKPTINRTLFETDAERLRNEVIALTITGQVFSFAEELIVPHCKTMFKELWCSHQGTEHHPHLATSDKITGRTYLEGARKQAILPTYNVQDDILEMVIQFGYLALFAPVWPLISLGFFVNNWIELRSDFFKISFEHQRPAPVRSDGIGPWIYSLEFLAWFGSLSSAAIVHLFGSHHSALGIVQRKIGTWCSLPITIFVSEHLFLVFRTVIRFVLHRIGSRHRRRDQDEEYAERRLYQNALERDSKPSSLDADGEEGSQPIRSISVDADPFWSTQISEGSSVKAAAAIINILKDKRGPIKDAAQPKKD